MKKRLRSGLCMLLSVLILCSLLVIPTASAAEDGTISNPEAGKLKDVFADLKASKDFDELKITGELNLADMEFLSDYLETVVTMDLSEAEFVDPESTEKGEAVFFPKVFKCNNNLKTSLKIMKFPTGIHGVQDEAFENYSLLEEIYFQTGLTTIAHHAFSGCTNLKIIQFPDKPDTLELIEQYAFGNCNSLIEVNLPDSLTEIGIGAFSECTNLAKVRFPDALETISDYAFLGCEKLTSVQALGVTKIGKEAFNGCVAMQYARIPSCTAISEGAFLDNKILELVSMPSIKTIGNSAFENCEILRIIFLNDYIPDVGDAAFVGCSLENPIIVYLPCSIDDLDGHDLEGFPEDIKKTYYPASFQFSQSNYTVGVSETVDVDYTLRSAEGQEIKDDVIKEYLDWLLHWKIDNDKRVSLEPSSTNKGSRQIATGLEVGTATVTMDFHTAFTVDEAQCTIEVTDKKDPGIDPGTDPGTDPWKNPYDDIYETDWFYDEALYDYYNDLMKGTAPRIFSPKTPTTRGMVVTLLGRIEKIDTEDYQQQSFEDVKDDAYYAPYVAWAKENGVVMGVTEKLFRPERNCSREEIAELIHRYLKFKGIQLDKGNEVRRFADDNQIARYAKDSVYALAGDLVMVGKERNLFTPKDPALRREMAMMVYRVHQMVTDE